MTLTATKLKRLCHAYHVQLTLHDCIARPRMQRRKSAFHALAEQLVVQCMLYFMASKAVYRIGTV